MVQICIINTRVPYNPQPGLKPIFTQAQKGRESIEVKKYSISGVSNSDNKVPDDAELIHPPPPPEKRTIGMHRSCSRIGALKLTPLF